MGNEQFIEILRVRNFLEHNHKQITNIESEFTITSNKKNGTIDNIFLTFHNFLPNLKIVDSEGTEYPIMSNTDTKMLLEIMQEKNDSEELARLIQDVKGRKIFLIWIKIPPNKKLLSNETRILHLYFDNTKINKSGKRILLDVSSNLSFPVFWIFKKPTDYNITNQISYTVKDEKLTNKKSWKNTRDGSFYYADTERTSTLLVKPNQDKLIISYSFKPKASIIMLPMTSIVLLVSFSSFLIVVQNSAAYGWYWISPSLAENLLERKIELSLFIVSLSLIIPKFIVNAEIRHSYFWLWFVPIVLAIVFFFGIDFNGINANETLVASYNGQ